VSAQPPVLAVDIGGTKLAVALVDTDGRILWRDRVATPVTDRAGTVWSALAELVGRAPAGAGLCGVGCGGPMTGAGAGVSPLNIPAWRGFPLRARVAEATGLATWVDNDAKALTLAEGVFGAAVGRSEYLSMVVSSGVGGGLVCDGTLLDGADGNAGHIGHVVVVPEGHPCVCGSRGCLEAEASGMSIARITGSPAADAGPETIERVGCLVGRAVGSVANLLGLRLATVAGSVALGYGPPFFAAAQAELDQRARLAFSRGCQIVPSALLGDGPLVGAACVAWRGVGSLRLGSTGAGESAAATTTDPDPAIRAVTVFPPPEA
jgi:glucokinase